MSAENKKLIWIISAIVFFLVVFAFASFVLFAPKKGGAQAPATIGNTAAPKAQDPQDFLSAPPPVPALEQPRNKDGSIVIVYGDKPKIPAATTEPPASANPADGATASSQAASSAATPSTEVPSAPAPSSEAPTGTAKTAPASIAPPMVKTAPAATRTARKILPRPTTAKVGEYWIQAASFTSRGRADELKQGLADKGVAVLISVKDIAGKSWYRVRIGPYSVKADADGWLARLKDVPGCSEAYVSKTIATKAIDP